MSDQKSTVVIPCAGKGTRLYPLTKNISKSLVKIGNYKMIDYAISECILGNIDRIVFIISPEDEQLKDHISCINNNKKLPGLKKNEYVDIDIKIVEQKKIWIPVCLEAKEDAIFNGFICLLFWNKKNLRSS